MIHNMVSVIITATTTLTLHHWTDGTKGPTKESCSKV